MEDFEGSMSDCSVDSNELPPMPPLIRINRNISEYGTLSAQTSSDSPITGVDQRMQNAVAKVLPDIVPGDTLSFHKVDTSGASPVPPLARRSIKGGSSASALDHYEICISSPSKSGQVSHDERKGARPGKSFKLGFGDDSPSKYSGNADPELPVQPVLILTANTTFSSYPLDHSILSETGKMMTSEEGGAIDTQGVRGHDIRHHPVGSQITAMVPDHGKSSIDKALHKCRECPRQFKSAFHLRRHERDHTAERSFKCDVCSKYLSHSWSLKVHKRFHTGEKPFACKVCQASFRTTSDLSRHERVHTGKRPYKCATCEASFKQSADLRYHERMHTGERPYKCETCEASFKHSTHLRNHERMHTGERPYKCETCEASFKQSPHLRDHERIHTGEKPHQCKVCCASFRWLSTLRSHERGSHWIVHRGTKRIDRIR